MVVSKEAARSLCWLLEIVPRKNSLFLVNFIVDDIQSFAATDNIYLSLV